METAFRTLSGRLTDDLAAVRAASGGSADLLSAEITIGGVPCCLLTCEGMVAGGLLAELVTEPLNQLGFSPSDSAALLEMLRTRRLFSADSTEVREIPALLKLLYAGFAVLLIDGAGTAPAFGVQGYASRSIAEPSGEQNIYGAKEGFTEPVRTNMSLLRRRMKSPLLTFELLSAGTVSQTDLCLCWLRDRVPAGLLGEIRETLSALPLETVLSAGYIRPFLEHSDSALVHSVGTTERPDVLCAKLLEGRVGILIDGTPFALVIPQLLCETFQTLDDYNYPPAYATLLRWLKYAAGLTALLLPACYLAVSLHHPALMHETLLRLLTESEQNAPFSLTAELLGILFVYEILREAGLRLPKATGSAVGIIGGLLIGDAAVQSGLISTPVLTVAALSATSGFVIPEHHAALTVLRPLFILAASAAGIAGIAVLGTALLCHVCATEAFGFPVSAPAAPLLPRRLSDVLARIGFRRLSQQNFRVSETRLQPDDTIIYNNNTR
ncbi:MAG: spore germination protein [Oscillospiraceae bacterium]|nr:spore germination protein [Oscillospiraceae bacterium]MCR5305264.1 spore germination protein [Oscillospiraceae bacterium]